MEAVVENKKVGIGSLTAYKDYMLMLIANLISRYGDSVDSIAYSYMVWKLTGSTLLMGTLFAINALPNILLSPFAGVIADRFNKKKLIIIGYTGRGIIVTLTAALFFTSLLEPWHLFVFTIINSTFETLTAPVFMSIAPLLIPKELYLAANSFSTSAYKFAELVGMATAALLIAVLGIPGAIFIDGITFFIAVFLIMFMRVKQEEASNEAISIKGYANDIKEGFNFIRKSYLIRTTLVLFAIVNFCLAPINVLMPAFADEVLKGDAGLFSILGISFTVGVIVGGLITGSIGSKFKKHWLISIGLIIFGASYSMLFVPGNVISAGIYSNIAAAAAFFIFGFIMPPMTAPLTTNIMLNTDKSMLGRVGSFMGMISLCAVPLGAAITGFISEIMPMTTIFAIMGGIIILLGIRMVFNRKFKELAG